MLCDEAFHGLIEEGPEGLGQRMAVFDSEQFTPWL